jgi:hypothetical protein
MPHVLARVKSISCAKGLNVAESSQRPQRTDVQASLLDRLYRAVLATGMTLTSPPIPEDESLEYAAFRLTLDHQPTLFRLAKVTPKKQGQFVTLWKRSHRSEPIAPIDTQDGILLVIILVEAPGHQGVFLFDRPILQAKNIFSINGKGGKRAFRLYPPWTDPRASDAIQTQRWQLPFYRPII